MGGDCGGVWWEAGVCNSDSMDLRGSEGGAEESAVKGDRKSRKESRVEVVVCFCICVIVFLFSVVLFYIYGLGIRSI